MKKKKCKNGIVLLFILGVLFLLAVLGIFYVTASKLEKVESANNVRLRRAQFGAMSGIEYTLVQIPKDLLSGKLAYHNADWVFHGEDTNFNGKLEPQEDTDNDNFLDILGSRLTESQNPSYRKDVQLFGRLVPVSGVITGLSKGSEEIITYKLRVVDENSRVYINGGNLLDPSDPANEPIKRILNNVGTLINIPGLGTKIIEHRPPEGYHFYKEFSSFLSQEEIEKVKEFISFFAYTYKNTVRPIGLTNRFSSDIYPAVKENDYIFAWKQLEPSVLTVEPRAPININQARRELLIALIVGLQGFYVEPTDKELLTKKEEEEKKAIEEFGKGATGKIKGKFFTPKPYPIGRIKFTKPISWEQAFIIADRIVQRRLEKPFLSFTGEDGFNAFCDKLREDGIVDRYQADVLKANFNPNTDTNIYNPNALLWKEVDKLALSVYSTEFCFYPMGFFQVDSLGQVWQNKRLTAESELHADIKIYDVWYDSTQKDFHGDSFANITSQISPSKDYPTRLNLALDTYPSPATPMTIPSPLDGQIALSTLENRVEDELPVVYGRASFRYVLDADYGSLGLAQPDEGGYSRMYPDGAYSEISKTLRYSGTGIVNFEMERQITKKLDELTRKLEELKKKKDISGASLLKSKEIEKIWMETTSYINALSEREPIPTGFVRPDVPLDRQLEAETGKEEKVLKDLPKITKDILLMILSTVTPEEIEVIQGKISSYGLKVVAKIPDQEAEIEKVLNDNDIRPKKIDKLADGLFLHYKDIEEVNKAKEVLSKAGFTELVDYIKDKFTVEDIRNAKKLLRVLFQVVREKLKWFVYFIPKDENSTSIISFTTPIIDLLSTATKIGKVIPQELKNWFHKTLGLYDANKFFASGERLSKKTDSELPTIVSDKDKKDKKSDEEKDEKIGTTYIGVQPSPGTIEHNTNRFCSVDDKQEAGLPSALSTVIKSYDYKNLMPEPLTYNALKKSDLVKSFTEQMDMLKEECPTPVKPADGGELVKWIVPFCGGSTGSSLSASGGTYWIKKDSFIKFFEGMNWGATHLSYVFGSGVGPGGGKKFGEETKEHIINIIKGSGTWGFPHNACWWDIYSGHGGGSGCSRGGGTSTSFGGSAHFYPPEFAPALILEVFKDQPDVAKIFMLQWKRSLVCWFHPSVFTWIKPNFVEPIPDSYNPDDIAPKSHILFSMTNGRPFSSALKDLQQFFISMTPSYPFSEKRVEKIIGWRMNDGFHEDEEEEGEAFGPSEVTGKYRSKKISPHRWYHLGIIFGRAYSEDAAQKSQIAAILGDYDISKRLMIYVDGKLVDTASSKMTLNRVTSLLDSASLGFRFGEINNRLFGVIGDKNDPWSEGFSGADTTYDEIIVLNERRSEIINTLSEKIYEKGRYYPGEEAKFTSQVKCLPEYYNPLLRITSNLWVPDNSSFELYFRIKSEYPKNDKDFEPLLIASSKVATNEPMVKPFILRGNTHYELTLKNKAPGKSLLETPFIDDITLFIGVRPTIYQEYYEYEE